MSGINCKKILDELDFQILDILQNEANEAKVRNSEIAK